MINAEALKNYLLTQKPPNNKQKELESAATKIQSRSRVYFKANPITQQAGIRTTLNKLKMLKNKRP